MTCFQPIGASPVVLVVEKDDQLLAAMGGVRFGWGPLAREQYMLDGLASPLAFAETSADSRPEIADIIGRFLLESRLAACSLVDYQQAWTQPPLPHVQTVRTRSIPLTADYQPVDPSQRQKIRQAERDHVTVRPISLVGDLDHFYALYAETEHSHGQKKLRYPRAMFELLASLSQTDNRLVWLVACKENELIGSHLYLNNGESALHWLTATGETGKRLRANQALLWHAIDLLRRAGARWLDLGGTPAGAESLDDYKRAWSESVRQHSVYSYRAGWLGASR